MTAPPPRLPEALAALRDRLAATRLRLATAERDGARRAARAVAGQIDDYLLPRLCDLDAPLLTVVGGSTGAGKSTLVNSLVGAPVTTAGVLRPTTRSPVLVCARPDVDSVVESTRELAGQLLAAADLWVFVTTAARYADAVPWDLLRTAQERGTALAVVLDRVPPEAAAEVAADLAGMLTRAGLAGARLFVVEERSLADGRLPEDQVAPLRDWLHELAADQGARAAVVRQTLTGALDSLEQRVAGVATAVEGQQAAATALHDAATAAYAAARAGVEAAAR
ncbi:MAG: hypothetical protein ACJ71Y_12790 [Blastococcus sp.]